MLWNALEKKCSHSIYKKVWQIFVNNQSLFKIHWFRNVKRFVGNIKHWPTVDLSIYIFE